MIRIYGRLSRQFECSWPLRHRMADGSDLTTRPDPRSSEAKHTLSLRHSVKPRTISRISCSKTTAASTPSSDGNVPRAYYFCRCSNIDLLHSYQERFLRRHLAWYLSFSLSWKTAVLRFTQGSIRRRPGPGRRSHNSHAVERAVNEEERNQKECQCQSVAQSGTGFQPQLHGKLNRKQSEQGCEFDHRIHRHRGRILEGIAHRIADDRGIVQRRAFLFQFHFHNFFGIVPGAAGVRHEDRLIQTENSDRDQISNEVEGLDKGKRQRGEKDCEEYIEHTLLRVLRADLNNLLAVGNRRFLHAFQPNVRFNELDCAISARSYRLRGSAREPINHCSAGDQSQNKRRM